MKSLAFSGGVLGSISGNLRASRFSPDLDAREAADWLFEVRLRRKISGTSSNRFLRFYKLGRPKWSRFRNRAPFRARISGAPFRTRVSGASVGRVAGAPRIHSLRARRCPSARDLAWLRTGKSLRARPTSV